MSTQHAPLNPPAPFRVTYAVHAIEGGLASAQGFDNFERAALREALRLLEIGDMPAAVAVLADGIRHAYRPGLVEDRPEEIAACCCAFALLTVGDESESQGGAA